ncbi:helix-turn-helix domain-containing protein [Micromonospora sp. NPDC050417]|uniref:helix-turn-helix domain-containing protein n=1 Tax=Micromonospora sp. NPDC050417 TaxID=3364280 RepID=UPI0037A13669
MGLRHRPRPQRRLLPAHLTPVRDQRSPRTRTHLPRRVARQANMSSRNLARHFKSATGTTPLQWLSTQRIRRAQELLENTDNSIDAIAVAAGMGTATTLRRQFNRTVGVPPDAYRRTFRSASSTSNQSSHV